MACKLARLDPRHVRGAIPYPIGASAYNQAPTTHFVTACFGSLVVARTRFIICSSLGTDLIAWIGLSVRVRACAASQVSPVGRSVAVTDLRRPAAQPLSRCHRPQVGLMQRTAQPVSACQRWAETAAQLHSEEGMQWQDQWQNFDLIPHPVAPSFGCLGGRSRGRIWPRWPRWPRSGRLDRESPVL